MIDLKHRVVVVIVALFTASPQFSFHFLTLPKIIEYISTTTMN